MSHNLLKGKKGIIFGALNEHSIAWKCAEHAFSEGAEIVLTNTPLSLRLGEINKLAEKCGSKIIPADATSLTDLQALITGAMEHFGGGLDFVLHSVGMSPNVRKKKPYESLSYNFMMQTLDISAISFHKLLHLLYENKAMNQGGSIVALTYIASQRAIIGYNDMADAKALLESITRNFGIKFGQKKGVRINTVSQSPTLSTAGQGIEGMRAMYDYAQALSPLGNATADDCADYVVTLFSDLTRKVTMQNLYHDGGFSSTGLTAQVIENFKKGLELA